MDTPARWTACVAWHCPHQGPWHYVPSGFQWTPRTCRRLYLHVLTSNNSGRETLPSGSPRECLGGLWSSWEPLGRFEFVCFSLKIQENCISQGARDPRSPKILVITIVWGLVARVTYKFVYFLRVGSRRHAKLHGRGVDDGPGGSVKDLRQFEGNPSDFVVSCLGGLSLGRGRIEPLVGTPEKSSSCTQDSVHG